MIDDKHIPYLAIFMNGGTSAKNAKAQKAVRALVHEDATEATDAELAQIKSEAASYRAHPEGHKSNHDQMADALEAAHDELAPKKDAPKKDAKKG